MSGKSRLRHPDCILPKHIRFEIHRITYVQAPQRRLLERMRNEDDGEGIVVDRSNYSLNNKQTKGAAGQWEHTLEGEDARFSFLRVTRKEDDID